MAYIQCSCMCIMHICTVLRTAHAYAPYVLGYSVYLGAFHSHIMHYTPIYHALCFCIVHYAPTWCIMHLHRALWCVYINKCMFWRWAGACNTVFHTQSPGHVVQVLYKINVKKYLHLGLWRFSGVFNYVLAARRFTMQAFLAARAPRLACLFF